MTKEEIEDFLNKTRNVYNEFEGYQYNESGSCLNPTIFYEYKKDDTYIKLEYSKTERGYVTGEWIQTGSPDYWGGVAGCDYNYSTAFDNERDAKIHKIDSTIGFLEKQIEGKKGIAEAIQNAKEFKMSIMYKQLELF